VERVPICNFADQLSLSNVPVAASALMTDRMVHWGELCATAIVNYLPVVIFTLLVRKYLIKGFIFGPVVQ